jgi:ABC-2 type transport system permease protein
MMLSNLVRLPLIFVSGVFVPHAQMPAWGQWLAPFSPLSYAADLIRLGFGEGAYFGAAADVAALTLFAVLLLAAARLLHARAQARGR